MSAPDRGRLTRAIRRLTAGVNAPTNEAADARLDRFCTIAARSARNMDAAFAAVQRLRDLEAIDRSEAAYLLNELFDYQSEKRWSKGDPDLQRAVEEEVPHELIMAAMSDGELARAAAFHRERGEDELADMLLERPEEYTALCADGQISLIDDKPPADEDTEPVTPPPAPQALFERVLALSATETTREWVPAWQALCEALRATDPTAAVAAIQSVRDLGGISFDESLVLIDMAIDTLVDDALAADRECHRLERAIADFNARNNIDEGDGAADETRPLPWRVLQHRRTRRIEGLTAVVLRRFGEHRLANLLTTNPEEYGRIRDEIGVGGG